MSKILLDFLVFYSLLLFTYFIDEELYEMERESSYLGRHGGDWEEDEDDGLHMKVPKRTNL